MELNIFIWILSGCIVLGVASYFVVRNLGRSNAERNPLNKIEQVKISPWAHLFLGGCLLVLSIERFLRVDAFTDRWWLSLIWVFIGIYNVWLFISGVRNKKT